jgi:signal transduction histidine kinase
MNDRIEPVHDDCSPCGAERGLHQLPEGAASHDPDVLRAALLRESAERRRAECQATMQNEVAKLAIDLLAREPDVEAFFGALTRTMVEESEGFSCGVWLIDEDAKRCELWMAYVKDQLITSAEAASPTCEAEADEPRFPCEYMAAHLFEYSPGWRQTVEYQRSDPRFPEPIREFQQNAPCDTTITTPLMLGDRTLGWMTVTSPSDPQAGSNWWRVVLIEGVARQAALALHYSRLVELNRLEERRKGVLEERNRLARDIHDNLAQGFAAILMQLQGTRRDVGGLPPAVARSIETATDLAREHLTEARRSVGALRPNVGSGEDIETALKRLADMGQRTAGVPVDLLVEELPRLGDVVEREVIGIAQEALTNALRHARAKRITIRASTVQSVGLRLSVADDGRGIPRERPASGFGMTSMQERADRIGASLTIVTAPRDGTEVVLAWEPSSLPTQVHVAG